MIRTLMTFIIFVVLLSSRFIIQDMSGGDLDVSFIWGISTFFLAINLSDLTDYFTEPCQKKTKRMSVEERCEYINNAKGKIVVDADGSRRVEKISEYMNDVWYQKTGQKWIHGDEDDIDHEGK